MSHLAGSSRTANQGTARGQVALAESRANDSGASEPAFDRAQADVARVHDYLTQFAAKDRESRIVLGTMGVGLGMVAASIVLALAVQPDRQDTRNAIIGLSGTSAALIGSGLYFALRSGSGELALARFEREQQDHPDDTSGAVAAGEHALATMARRARQMRIINSWVHFGAAFAFAFIGTGVATSPVEDDEGRRDRAVGAGAFFASAAMVGAIGVALRFVETPAERMWKLYRRDSLRGLRLGGALTSTAWSFGLRGSF